MKRVLHFLDSLEISGGVQAVVMNAHRNLDHSLVQFDFAVYDSPEANSYRQEIEALGGKVYLIGALSEVGFREYLRRIKGVLAACHYDAVHAHNLHHNGLILWAAKRAGVPVRISHCHQAWDERNTSFARRCMVACLKRLLYHSATRLVACSDKAAEFLYGKRPYTFLPNAISLEDYSKQPDVTSMRQQFGIARDTRVILHVGRFCLPKNHCFDLEIMEALAGCGDYRLLLVGSGELETELRVKIHEHHLEEVVMFLGLRNDVPALLKMADIVILPSIHEGLPMVAIEAQAAGIPIVLSDVITRQADLGLGLVSYLPLLTELWKERIIEWAQGEKPKITASQCANAFSQQGFDIVSNIKRWMELYQQ